MMFYMEYNLYLKSSLFKNLSYEFNFLKNKDDIKKKSNQILTNLIRLRVDASS